MNSIYNFSAIGYFIIGILVQALLFYLKRKKLKDKWPKELSTLDILPIYWCFVFYIATGQYLTYSPFIYALLGWLIFGLLLSTYLLWLKKNSNWNMVNFFHKYWQWTGLLAAVSSLPFLVLNIF